MINEFVFCIRHSINTCCRRGQYKNTIYLYNKALRSQGTNARKVISEVYAFLELQCTVLGRKSKHKTDVTAWHEINKIINEIFWSTGNYYLNYQNYQNWMLLSSSDLDEHWGIYSCLQIPPRENWFQYVRREYTTAMSN